MRFRDLLPDKRTALYTLGWLTGILIGAFLGTTLMWGITVMLSAFAK